MTTLELLTFLLAVGAFVLSGIFSALTLLNSREIERDKANYNKDLEAIKHDFSKELETIKANYGTKSYISQKKYDLELGIYQTLWNSLADINQETAILMDYIRRDKSKKGDYKFLLKRQEFSNLLTSMSSSISEYFTLLESKRPFIPEDLFNSLYRYRTGIKLVIENANVAFSSKIERIEDMKAEIEALENTKGFLKSQSRSKVTENFLQKELNSQYEVFDDAVKDFKNRLASSQKNIADSISKRLDNIEVK